VIRVVLADDHAVVRQGLRTFLDLQDDIEVVAEAGDGEGAVEAALRTDPDVVLLDLVMPGVDGLAALARLRESRARVIVLTSFGDDDKLFAALRAGAAGYLLKRISGEELVQFLERVHAGETVVDAAMAGRVASSAARLDSGEFWPGARIGLSQRESEVLGLIVAGLSNQAIASRLVIGAETVKSHARAIYRKLGVSDRAGAVAAALREGLYR
jgi:DNA-binding NarL/FixJ family response regulator